MVFSHLTPLIWVRMGLLFGCLGMKGCSIFPIFITSDVESFKIPDATWKSQLLVRQNPGGELLFKLSDSTSPGGVYRYVPELSGWSMSFSQAWETSMGGIVACGDRSFLQGRYYPPQPLLAGQKFLASQGNYAVNKIAVLSVDGPRRGGVPPFLTVGDLSWLAGQVYHQLFSVTPLQPLGPPVRLPFQLEHPFDGIEICWSPDNNYVIYNQLKLKTATTSYSYLGESPESDKPFAENHLAYQRQKENRGDILIAIIRVNQDRGVL